MSHGEPNSPYGPPPPQAGPYYGGQNPYGVPPQGYGHPYPPAPTGVPPIASMGRRLAARVIDGVPLTILNMVLMAPSMSDYFHALGACDSSDTAAFSSCVQEAAGDFYSGIVPVALAMTAVVFLYEWLMISLVGATLGKLAVGLRVLKAENGAKPGLTSGFLRWVIPMVGAFACGIGMLVVYLSPFWDKSGRKQGWHDKVAGTVVVHTKG
ncbi:RDD family protein [Streptomyces sp. NPDC002790]|uniref:RDD family protein n=1 Tax=Streptomyces sp. NPDC002790 TaxID=3154431 RepID=UPI00331E0C28